MAEDWAVGMTTTSEMSTWGGREATQRTISAMSSGERGLSPA
jgi:hypothetical protein